MSAISDAYEDYAANRKLYRATDRTFAKNPKRPGKVFNLSQRKRLYNKKRKSR